MTNSKDKNNKTKITTSLTALLIGLVLLSPTMMMPNINALNGGGKPADIIFIEQHLPKSLTGKNLSALKELALSNAQVQKIINGEPYAFMAQDFVGNVRTEPGVWYPQIHINVANQTEITIQSDLSFNKALNIITNPIDKLGPIPISSNGKSLCTPGGTCSSFAIDYYSGSHSINGIYDEKTAPSTNGSPPVVAFLLNGLETSAITSGSCTSADYYTDYFAQGGFDYTSGTPVVAYTDTKFNCIGQNSGIPYAPGDVFFYEIYVAPGTTQWNILDEDLNTAKSHVYAGPTVQSSAMQTSNYNTSVFFENHSTSTNWAGYFTSSVQATDAHFRDFSTGSWSNWDADSKQVLDCGGNPQSNNVMTGGLANGGTTTWSMSAMEAYHC